MTKSCRRKTDHVLLGMTICVRADGKEREKEGLDVTHGCPEGKKNPTKPRMTTAIGQISWITPVSNMVVL